MHIAEKYIDTRVSAQTPLNVGRNLSKDRWSSKQKLGQTYSKFYKRIVILRIEDKGCMCNIHNISVRKPVEGNTWKIENNISTHLTEMGGKLWVGVYWFRM
jgi:hypothetical protein